MQRHLVVVAVVGDGDGDGWCIVVDVIEAVVATAVGSLLLLLF